MKFTKKMRKEEKHKQSEAWTEHQWRNFVFDFSILRFLFCYFAKLAVKDKKKPQKMTSVEEFLIYE